MSDVPAFDPSQPFEPAEPVAQAESAPQAQASAKPVFDPNQSFDEASIGAEEKPEHVPEFGEDFGEALSAGIKGVGRGLTLGQSDKWAQREPVFPWDLPAEKASDIQAQKENSPLASEVGHIVGSGALLLGGEGITGTGAAISKMPTLVKTATGTTVNFAKIGANLLRDAIESGIVQGGDEVSKSMLGQSDPNTAVSSAITNIGAATLLGLLTGGIFSAGGGGLARLGESRLATKMSKLGEDFGSQLRFMKDNPEPVEAMRNEINSFHNSTLQGGEAAWDLKDSAIQKLVPEMNPIIAGQNQEISKTLEDQVAKMVKNPNSFPERLTQKFQEDANKWMEVTTNPEATSHEVFNATQDLKRKMQFYAKYERQINPLSAEGPFIDSAKDLASKLKNNLEDTNVWGDAGKLQKGINNAYSELIKPKGPLKTFTTKFMSNDGTDVVADPGKINTFLNQLGSPRAGVKKDILENYMSSMEKYRNSIEDLHHNVGLDSPFTPASMNVTQRSLGQMTNGSKLADLFMKKAPGYIGKAVGEGGGAFLGGTGGFLAGREIAPLLEDSIGRPVTDAGTNALLKVLETQSYKSTGEALAHANNVQKGAKKIGSAMDALFKIGGQRVVDSYVSDRDKEKLKEHIDHGGVTQNIQNQLNFDQQQQAKQPKPPGFAEGGEVKAPKPVIPDVQDSKDNLSAVYPDHAMMLQTAKGTVSNYLNSLRPQANTAKLPFDSEPDQTHQHKTYDRAIHLAIDPLSVLNHVKDGSISKEDMKHLTQMYPDLHGHLSKEITKKISQNQLDGDKPNYKTRQGLSVFLGTPMDSTFTPASIQAAQSVFAQQKAANQSAGQAKTKKGTSKLGDVSKQYQTPDQAAQSRQTSSR